MIDFSSIIIQVLLIEVWENLTEIVKLIDYQWRYQDAILS